MKIDFNKRLNNVLKNTGDPALKRRAGWLIKNLDIKHGDRVLDIGCGRGELVFWSAIKGADVVIGIDYSKK